MDDRYFRRFQIMFLLPFFYCKFSFLEYQISCLIFFFKFQLIFQRLFMYSISLIRKIQARFQPSPLDNWISNGKILNLGYEKPLLKPSFPEFNVDIMRQWMNFQSTICKHFFIQYDHDISEFVVGFSYQNFFRKNIINGTGEAIRPGFTPEFYWSSNCSNVCSIVFVLRLFLF